jgi:hypothetical protein
MLTLNSKALKIGNKWLNPINGSGPTPPSTTYYVTTSGSHGSVVASPTEGTTGTEVTLSNTPDTHYHFDSYTLTGATLKNANQFDIANSDVSVVGNFLEDTKYTVTCTNDGNGTVAASPTSNYSGSTVTLSNTPNSGYEFDSYTLVSGTGASISGNTLTIGTSNVTVRGNFAQGASYDHYELEIRNDTTSQQVAICGMNVRPDSGSTIMTSISALSTEDIDKIVDSTGNQAYDVTLSPASGEWIPAKYLLLRFNSLSGNLTWYDTLNPYHIPSGGFSSATLYGVDSNNNRTQLSQIGPVTNTYNVQRSLHV